MWLEDISSNILTEHWTCKYSLYISIILVYIVSRQGNYLHMSCCVCCEWVISCLLITWLHPSWSLDSSACWVFCLKLHVSKSLVQFTVLARECGVFWAKALGVTVHLVMNGYQWLSLSYKVRETFQVIRFIQIDII